MDRRAAWAAAHRSGDTAVMKTPGKGDKRNGLVSNRTREINKITTTIIGISVSLGGICPDYPAAA